MGSVADLKVALIRCPPPNWPLPLQNRDWTGIKIDISTSVDAGIELIKEAQRNGAALVAFPELWFPGFPKWREQNGWKHTHLASYIDNSLVVGGVEWNRLIDAIKSTGIWTALAFSERRDDNLFMAQALISPQGETVLHRHKLRPSGSERQVFSDGTIDMLKVINTPLGRVGMLQCGDMTFPMAAQRPKLHIGAWPMAFDFDDDSDSVYYNASLVTRGSGSYALNSGAYVLMPSVGYCFIYDPLMRIVASMDNAVSYTEHPILYHTLDASIMNPGEHDPGAQASWDVLQQLNQSLSKKIPREAGGLVPHQKTSIEWLKSGELKWDEIAPGTPWPAHLPHD